MNKKSVIKSKTKSSFEDLERNTLPRNNLSKPAINSTKRYNEQINQLLKVKVKFPTENEIGLLIPTKHNKLNFSANQKIFRNLTSINVNDSLLPKANKVTLKKNAHHQDSGTAPNLQDYLESVSPFELVSAEPEIELEIIEYEFDVMSSYKDFIE